MCRGKVELDDAIEAVRMTESSMMNLESTGLSQRRSGDERGVGGVGGVIGSVGAGPDDRLAAMLHATFPTDPEAAHLSHRWHLLKELRLTQVCARLVLCVPG